MCIAVRDLGRHRLPPRDASTAAYNEPYDLWGSTISNAAPQRGGGQAPLGEFAPRPVALVNADQASPDQTSVDRAMVAQLRQFDVKALRREFVSQGSFLYLKDFLPPAVTARLVAAVCAFESSVNRNYLPGHKQGGSVSRHTIDELAPFIADLYRSPALMAWLGQLADEPLQVSPNDDPHAYALYFYTRAGDHVGWHYDTSYYRGRRYTLLLGVVDESSCRLDYELHTRESDTATISGSMQYPPGALVFFDGDKLRHRVTPAREGDRRVSLTFEYVTDPSMHAGWRLISNMKDAVAYFGLRQVFRRTAKAKSTKGRSEST